jgi:integrase
VSITASAVESYLAKRGVSPVSKDNDRRAISRFFSWAVRKQRWLQSNPCHNVRVERGETDHAPEILTLKEVRRLIAAAKRFKGGRLAAYVAASLFGGFRPFEVARLKWEQVNLNDAEIRLESTQSKTKRGRVVKLFEPLVAWLRWCQDNGVADFYPSNWRKDFDALRAKAKLTRWPEDVLRHTAVSHYFRKTGSYGLTAEWAGNSEGIIKRHYQGRVSTDDAALFWNLVPLREQRRKLPANVIKINRRKSAPSRKAEAL